MQGLASFRAKVLIAATDAHTQPELLKLCGQTASAAELQRHSQEARGGGLTSCSMARFPTATPGADPRGRLYRELGAGGVAAFYHQLLSNLFEGPR